MLWRDRSGTFSPLKAMALALALAPALWIALQAALGWLGMRPITEAIHQTGDWTVYLLLITLAVTPLRRIGNWPRLILVRRTIGVSVACYAALHLALYIVDQKFDLIKVATEIALRIYLTIGFVAVAVLVTLALTSRDSVVKRLGAERWNRLHRLVYPVAVLGLLHYFMQSKINVTSPVQMAGLFLLLMGHRLMMKYGWPSTTRTLAALAIIAALLTAALEALWYLLATGVDPVRILNANLDFEYSIRPMWWILMAGLATAIIPVFRPAIPSRSRNAA